MKYGVISDVHGNFRALETVLADGSARGVDKWIFCGDATGYGYDAPACVAALRKCASVALLGNHDEVCVARSQTVEMRVNPNYDIDRLDRKLLSAPDVAWLRKRPVSWSNGDFACAHGDFTSPADFNYIMDLYDASLSFNATPERLLFVGHLHHAEIFLRSPKGVIKRWKPRSFKIRDGWRYLVNLGSVGYPRNDMVTTYCIYDDRAGELDFRELRFDFKDYIEKMLNHDRPLPGWLTAMLLSAVGGKKRS
ncbi:MAG: metallophosphoesterase family protein [Kiritimatiellae bacterium]|nr:metallophosphoesterase family protein [Kiritimatiellia bacterium]